MPPRGSPGNRSSARAGLDTKRARIIEEYLCEVIHTYAGHPAVLCYVLANEIPASIIRWYGHRRVANFLERLFWAAKAEDPDGLVTYVNYPTTEYLQLPFLDLVAFNVYLESREQMEAYLARLQNLAEHQLKLVQRVNFGGLLQRLVLTGRLRNLIEE